MAGSSPTSRAETVFAEHLAALSSGAEADIAALCRDHPDIALDLRALNQNYQALLPVLRLAGLGSQPQRHLADEIRSRYGDEADPHVSLEGAPSEENSPSSELLKRLEAHAPSNFRYRLIGEVGRGGMGAVLRVWDEDLRRTLAMKVVLGKEDSTTTGNPPPVDSRMLGRFLEEAQVTGQLDHPGIVPVHELGLDSGGRVYFTMRLVKGEDLRQIYEHVLTGEDGWNQTRALGVLLKVCEAMSYAHDKGVIHRDLKPANVMVGKYGEVYVMDWGLARVLGKKDRHDLRIQPEPKTSVSVRTERGEAREETPDSPIVTMDGDVVGTPAYMSPEQARGETAALGPPSDVYAVGAMLYHLLAGQMPFVPRNAKVSARTVLMRVLEGPPVPVQTLAPDAPAELVAICEKAMAREASRRYADTHALAEDLRAFIEHRVVGAYETGTWAETKKWVQRNKPLATSLAAAVLLLVVGLTASLVFKARADEKAANVLKLSAFQTLDDLAKEADALWPAEPGLVQQYRMWMTKAEELVAKLPEFRKSLAEIEQRALPSTDEERAQERASHPRAKELEAKIAQLGWLERMLGEKPWPSEVEAESRLSKETLPADAIGLNTLAWSLVDPDKQAYGSEVRGLLLARRALASASPAERAGVRDSLAWADFELGRFDDAIEEEQHALEEVESAKHEEYQGYLKKLEGAVRGWGSSKAKVAGQDDQARTTRVKERVNLAQEVAALEVQLSMRRTWRFAEDAGGGESGDHWWHAQLLKLITSLESFEDPKMGLIRGTSEVHGWSVGKRLDFASSVEERTVAGAEAKRLWSEAIDAIAASGKYRGAKWRSEVRLTPQLGLLPIGPDPASGLWEFLSVETGEPPLRGADGRLRLCEETGLVFVLIPGGTFWMGAQKTDPNGRNYDPQAIDFESPVHEVTLSPYFLSKYEMTQGQWERFTGRNPSLFRKANYNSTWNRAGHGWNALQPVEQVSWTSCVEVLGRLGCELPTEAQWENGCRAGTSSVYWSGDGLAGLGEAANVADAYAHVHGGEAWTSCERNLDDGSTIHAEVGSYSANAYGLHDVHGNVWEQCRDGFSIYSDGMQVDPVAPWKGASNVVSRGGSFINAPSLARSAGRQKLTPEAQGDNLGLRPARALTP